MSDTASRADSQGAEFSPQTQTVWQQPYLPVMPPNQSTSAASDERNIVPIPGYAGFIPGLYANA